MRRLTFACTQGKRLPPGSVDDGDVSDEDEAEEELQEVEKHKDELDAATRTKLEKQRVGGAGLKTRWRLRLVPENM